MLWRLNFSGVLSLFWQGPSLLLSQTLFGSVQAPHNTTDKSRVGAAGMWRGSMFALLSWLILDPVADDTVLRREADSANVPGNSEWNNRGQPGVVGHNIQVFVLWIKDSIELLELLSFLFSSLFFAISLLGSRRRCWSLSQLHMD